MIVRAATTADAAAIAGVYAPYVLDTVVTFEEVAPTADEVAARMVDVPRLPWFVASVEDVVVGFAYASSHRARAAYRWSVDVSVYLRADQTGRGTGRALYAVLLPELARLGYASAFAGIALPNAASVGLHTSLGFEPVGTYRAVGFKHGAWRDVGWWQLRLGHPSGPPVEPRSWGPA